MNTSPTPTKQRNFRGAVQLRLFPLKSVRTAEPVEAFPAPQWTLRDLRALAIDPDVEIRRLAALSKWTIDVDLQLVLAHDPDEQVVLNLLSKVDPYLEVTQVILDGAHPQARRELARRNIRTELLLPLIDDADDEVRSSARRTLEFRGVPVSHTR